MYNDPLAAVTAQGDVLNTSDDFKSVLAYVRLKVNEMEPARMGLQDDGEVAP